jgi:tRNA threonylcarbamoyl adenosine modification protein YeaZ
VTADPTLAIVTCGPQLEVAFTNQRMRAPSVVRLAGVSPRSTLLLAAVDLLLEDAGEVPEHLGLVLVSRGPGSFTGIRAGLASVSGLASATGATTCAYDSLTVQAARCTAPGTVWAAQPGRRNEVYARQFAVAPGKPPQPQGEIQIMAVSDLHQQQPWVAAEALSLGQAQRAVAGCSAAEALLRLHALGVEPQPCEPLYIEGPPLQKQNMSP